MKRTIIAAAVLALGTAGAGVSLADPGPGQGGGNGVGNTYGLCNAYSHNNPNAHKAPPFAALEQAAEAYEDQTGTQEPTEPADDAAEDVANYCANNGGTQPGNSGH